MPRLYKLYLVITPLGSKGGSQDTSSDCGELTTTLMSAGGPGTVQQIIVVSLITEYN